MSGKTEEDRMIETHAFWANWNIKRPEGFGFSPDQDQKVNWKMTDDYIEILKMHQWPSMESLQQLWWFEELWAMVEMSFIHGLRVNATDELEKVVRHGIENLSKVKLYTYQQDIAPSHSAKTNQE